MSDFQRRVGVHLRFLLNEQHHFLRRSQILGQTIERTASTTALDIYFKRRRIVETRLNRINHEISALSKIVKREVETI